MPSVDTRTSMAATPGHRLEISTESQPSVLHTLAASSSLHYVNSRKTRPLPPRSRGYDPRMHNHIGNGVLSNSEPPLGSCHRRAMVLKPLEVPFNPPVASGTHRSSSKALASVVSSG